MKSKTKKEISLLGIASLLFCLVIFIGFLGPAITGFTVAEDDMLFSIPVEPEEQAIAEDEELISIPSDSDSTIEESEEILGIPEDMLFGISAVPTHSQPLLNSTTTNNYTTENITCFNQSTADGDGNTVRNIYNWYKNNISIMVLNMPFDHDNSGGAGKTKDYSGFGNNGTETGSVAWTSSGKIGGAYVFDGGGTQYIDVGSDNSLEIGSEGTVEAWVYARTRVRGAAISKDAAGYNDDMAFGIDIHGKATDKMTLVFNRAPQNDIPFVEDTVVIPLNTWVHYVGTWSASGMKLYTNGTEVDSDPTACEMIASGQAVYVGRTQANYFNGTLDEVRIYNRSLSASQVYQRYLDTKDNYSANETLTSAETSAGEVWKCEITPNDGSGDGTAKNSSFLTIRSLTNLVPTTTLESPADNYASASEEITFTCSATDNDGVNDLKNITLYGNFTGTFQANASNLVTGTSNSTTFTVNISVGSYIWNCITYDTADLSDWGNNNRTITTNNMPTHSQPVLNASTANNYTTDNLTCYNVSSADIDGDTITNIYNWYKDGNPIMVLNLPFDHDNSGGSSKTKDYSGYGNNGTEAGGITWTSSGKVGGAYVFDGSSDYIVIDSVASEITATSFSVFMWINTTGTSDEVLAINTAAKGNRLIFRSRAAGLDVFDSAWSGNPSETVADGNWHYVGYTFQYPSRNVTVYVDTIEDYSVILSSVVASDDLVSIGQEWDVGASDFFDGIIDEVRIYDAALSSSQIYQLYQDTKDGHSQNQTIVSDETSTGENWTCEITPSDGKNDGTALNSSNVAVVRNDPPNQPALNSPLNNSVGIRINPILNVTVIDLNADSLDANFFGRAYNADNNNFTIVVLPDTQFYSQKYPSIFTNQTNWITNNIDELNIQFVVHEGDIVQNGDNSTQWDYANTSMSILDGTIPYSITPGNHDFETDGIANRNTSDFNKYFNFTRYQNYSWYGGHMGSDYDNNYHYFSAGGDDWMILSLEFCPTNEIMDWANSTILNNSDKKVIVITHSYMYSDDTRVDAGDSWECGSYACGGNNGEEIWDNYFKYHNNLILVLSGHVLNDGIGKLTSTGENGNNVHQLLANYQTLANGGNGYLRILTFNPTDNIIYVRTYSTYLDSYNTDSDEEFELSTPLTGGTNYTSLKTYTDIISGTTLNFTWTNLLVETVYNWYINISDRDTTVTSPVWNFTTTLALPTQSQPLLTSSSGNNYLTDNLICYNQSTADPNQDTVTNIYNWYKNSKPLMVLNLPFDHDDSGGTNQTKDYSGSGNNGTLGSSADGDAAEPTWTSSGKVGGAYTFDGVNDYIDAGSDNSLEIGSEGTVEAWVYAYDTTRSGIIEKDAAGYNDDVAFGIDVHGKAPGKMVFAFNRDPELDIPFVEDTINISLNTWVHYVGTWNSLSIKLYTNGTEVDSDPTACEMIASGQAVYIGRHLTNYFNGSIDKVRIYNHSLSATQIYQRYLDTKDGHSSNQMIVSAETSVGEVWKCEITPNDGVYDGAAKNSSTSTILSEELALPSAASSGGIGVNTITKQWETIDVGAETSMNVIGKPNIPIVSVDFTLSKPTTIARMTITLSDRPTSEPSGTIYKYVDITTTNIETKITSATIKFKVEKDWITRNNIDQNTIRLARLTNTWEVLSTKQLDEDSLYVYFEADTPGFSTFAIIADRLTAAELFPEEVEAAKVFEFKFPTIKLPDIKLPKLPKIPSQYLTLSLITLITTFSVGLFVRPIYTETYTRKKIARTGHLIKRIKPRRRNKKWIRAKSHLKKSEDAYIKGDYRKAKCHTLKALKSLDKTGGKI